MELAIQPAPGAEGTYGQLIAHDLETGGVLTEPVGLQIDTVRAMMPMDGGLNVIGGTHTDGIVRLSWTNMPVAHLPDAATPAFRTSVSDAATCWSAGSAAAP